jgi:hypothetical protein
MRLGSPLRGRSSLAKINSRPDRDCCTDVKRINGVVGSRLVPLLMDGTYSPVTEGRCLRCGNYQFHQLNSAGLAKKLNDIQKRSKRQPKRAENVALLADIAITRDRWDAIFGIADNRQITGNGVELARAETNNATPSQIALAWVLERIRFGS